MANKIKNVNRAARSHGEHQELFHAIMIIDAKLNALIAKLMPDELAAAKAKEEELAKGKADEHAGA